MNTKKKNLILIFIIILVILIISIVYILVQNNNNYSSNNIINNTVSENSNTQTIPTIDKEGLSMDDAIIEKIYPLTGAYPETNLCNIIKTKQIDTNSITNDFILKTAWTKVTKEDWADSYQGEAVHQLSIKSSILDTYIKDIFGDIPYQKTNFSTKDLVYDNAKTSLCDVIYNKQKDIYEIDINAGDGVDESFILIKNVKAEKYDNTIDITIYPLYLKNTTKMDDDGYFIYEAYQHYDFNTHTFSNKLLDNLTTIFDSSPTDIHSKISNLSDNTLESYTLSYKLNDNGNYIFSSLTSK